MEDEDPKPSSEQLLLGFAVIAICAALVGAALMALIWWAS